MGRDLRRAQFLEPRDFLRPRAISNLRPVDRMRGRVSEFGTPGALPMYFCAVRAFCGERSSTVPCPSGAWSASWSKVRHSPPAFTIRARAVSVNFRAQTRIFGTSISRRSSVTEPTTTEILPSLLFLMSFRKEIGPRRRRTIISRLRITLLNLEEVRRDKNLYSLMRSAMYGFVDSDVFRAVDFTRPPAFKSIPIVKGRSPPAAD